MLWGPSEGPTWPGQQSFRLEKTGGVWQEAYEEEATSALSLEDADTRLASPRPWRTGPWVPVSMESQENRRGKVSQGVLGWLMDPHACSRVPRKRAGPGHPRGLESHLLRVGAGLTRKR